MESDRNETLSSDVKNIVVPKMEAATTGNRDVLTTEKNTHSNSRDTDLEEPKSKLDAIPNLTITSEEEMVKSSRSKSSPSSANSSPKILVRNQHHLLKGLSALSPPSTSLGSSRPSPQPSPPTRLRVMPGYSPKLGRRFDHWPDAGPSPTLSSPTSPSRKYFKLLSPPTTFAGGLRRGSEPLLDAVSGQDFNEIQMSMTDRRWEKLRSTLVAMKAEAFDVDALLESSPSSPPGSDLAGLKGNIDTQHQLSTLRKEVATLNSEMELTNTKLHHTIEERNSALAYIKKLKLGTGAMRDVDRSKTSRESESLGGMLDVNHNEKSNSDVGRSGRGVDNYGDDEDVTSAVGSGIYTRQLEKLRKESSTKEDVLSTLVQVVDELSVERSYLDHLMAVVLDRAPWMLDEVDRAGHWTEVNDDDDDDDDNDNDGSGGDNNGPRRVHNNSSDDEVWC